MQQSPTNSKECYFCIQPELQLCVTRSLYHKYNDSQSKIIDKIDGLIHVGKQRSVLAKKWEEIRFQIDEVEHLSKNYGFFIGKSQLMELLEYYKYRKFVPLFGKSQDNVRITDSLHLYYYDKLKLYYNQIKKKLSITLDPTELSSSQSNSMVTKSENSVENKSYMLQEIISSNNMRNYQTESKALEGVLNMLKKRDDRMKRIKSLRTEDCLKEGNEFNDRGQKKSRNLLEFLEERNKNSMKKGKKLLFRYMEQSKANKFIQNFNKIKAAKKTTAQSSKYSTCNETIKVRSRSESILKIKKQPSRNEIYKPVEKASTKQKTQVKRKYSESPLQRVEKQYIKSLPKIQVQFGQLRPSRSLSSITKNQYQNNQNHNQNGKIAAKPQTNRKQIDHQPYKASKLIMSKQKSTSIKNKVDKAAHTPVKNAYYQIDQNDNLASINRKKIEQLKLKSKRKKQSRK